MATNQYRDRNGDSMMPKRDFVIRNGVLVSARKDIVDAIVPKGVHTLGYWAFRDCTNLTTIDTSNVTTIGNWAFRG